MTLTNTALAESLWKLSQQFIDAHQEKSGQLPTVEKDDDWPSICVQSDADENLVYWQPKVAEEALTFENIESALDIELHDDIKVFYSTFYSDPIDAVCSEGNLSLLFAWNYDDFLRLQENIIGHVLMKKRLKQPISLFFAVTDEEDMILSINNDSGQVWVERVGCEPHKKVAESLAEFIEMLTPKMA